MEWIKSPAQHGFPRCVSLCKHSRLRTTVSIRSGSITHHTLTQTVCLYLLAICHSISLTERIWVKRKNNEAPWWQQASAWTVNKSMVQIHQVQVHGGKINALWFIVFYYRWKKTHCVLASLLNLNFDLAISLNPVWIDSIIPSGNHVARIFQSKTVLQGVVFL